MTTVREGFDSSVRVSSVSAVWSLTRQAESSSSFFLYPRCTNLLLLVITVREECDASVLVSSVRLLEALVRSTLSCLVDAKLIVDTIVVLCQELRETLHAGSSVSSLTGRGNWPLPPVWFSITAVFTAKSAGPPSETTVIRNRAVLPGSCRLQFQLFSERLRVPNEFGMRSFTYSFWPATSCSHIHNLLLDLVHAALLVSCLRHSPGTLLRQCGSRRWRCVHVGVHDFAMVIGHDGVTAQARTVSGHKY